MLPALDSSGLNRRIDLPRPSRPGEPFGIVAGGGVLPRLVAEGARGHGWTPVIIAVGDGWREDWGAYRHRRMKWSQTGDVFPYLAREGVRHLVFCGTISIRPDYRSMVPSLRTLALLPEILKIMRGGDDTMLRAVTRAFERRGFALHAVQDVVPELLAPEGLIAGRMPNPTEQLALRRAAEAAQQLGRLDIGQAAVASAERVIALEGIEGTRDMLERVAALRERGRIGRSERLVLVKSVKPQQDHRLDLPSIGAETIDQACAAGLSGIGVSAGAALVIDLDRLTERVGREDMFLLGLPLEG